MTSVARISNQSVPNHVSEDMIFITIPSAIYHKEEIFIAGLPDNIVVVQEKMRGWGVKRLPQSNFYFVEGFINFFIEVIFLMMKILE